MENEETHSRKLFRIGHELRKGREVEEREEKEGKVEREKRGENREEAIDQLKEDSIVM